MCSLGSGTWSAQASTSCSASIFSSQIPHPSHDGEGATLTHPARHKSRQKYLRTVGMQCASRGNEVEVNMRSALKASFVVTFSVAAQAACSGRVDDTGSDAAVVDSGPSDASDDSEAGQATCPSKVPTNGTACDVRGTCNYGAVLPQQCGGGYGTSAVCKSGKWEVMMQTCNPPALIDASTQVFDAGETPLPCPTTAPTEGSACQGSGSPVCLYDTDPSCAGPELRVECTMSNVWKTTHLTCSK